MYRTFLIALLAITLPLHATASPDADQIFPDTTKGFFSIKNLKDFGDQWSQTQFGKLTNDPLLENFKKEIQSQLTERMERTFGLTLDGISSLPSGEIAFGMIAIPHVIPGYVLTMDVAEKRKEADEYLANLTQKLVSAGVKKTTEVYRGQEITVLTFPLPEAPRALPGTRVEITFKPVERKAYYMFLQDVLIASDRPHLLHFIADRLTGQSTTKSLAEVESYQTVMKRCLGDMPNGVSPIIRWYIEPLDYGESVRTVLQNQNQAIAQRTRPSIFSILKQQGFDAVRGIGGAVSLTGEDQETVYRTFIHTQKPYRLAMRMLEFPDNTNFVPPIWMPTDLARCTMMYVDPQAIFDNFGVLFDAIIMPGEEGVWKDILDGLENDPLGPQINIREELIAHLGNRAMGMSRYDKPITIKSESIVVAVELKSGHESGMSAGIEKLFRKDKEWKFTMHGVYKIWHRVPDGDIIAPDEDWLPPPLFGNESGNADTTLMVVRGQAGNVDPPPMFPEGGVVVAQGCLFVSTNIEYLKEVLDRLDAPAGETIKDAAEYRRVEQVFGNMGMTDAPHFFQFFARTHETMRSTYEMIRQDRMAQSQALLGKLLNEFLSPESESGVRRQMIDGSTLPAFERVEQYFGTVGIFGKSESNGYFIKGFTLVRER